MGWARVAGALLACAMTCSAVADVTVYTENFDGALGNGNAVWSGEMGTTFVQNFSTLAASSSSGTFSGNMLWNATGGDASGGPVGRPGDVTRLTLSNLPPHDALSIGFLLAVIDSWDGADGSPSPDFFEVSVDGTVVFQQTFANASGTGSYAGASMSGAANSAASPHPQLGFNPGGTYHTDEGYDLSLAAAGMQRITHTSSTAVIEFRAFGEGWQGGTDESWGIDNLRVGIHGCYADCTGEGTLDIFDLLCFQDAFTVMDPYADCDGNSVFDIFDFLCFQDAFITACP